MKPHIPRDLSRANTVMAESLRRAASALVELDRLGCQVHALVIRDCRPVLLIEAPPGGLVGAVRMHQRSQGRREAIWMATVAECRVEWAAPAIRAVRTEEASHVR